MLVLPASALPRPELLRVFNAGYSDYLVPLQLDERSFAEYLDLHDVDLDCSMVLADPDRSRSPWWRGAGAPGGWPASAPPRRGAARGWASGR